MLSGDGPASAARCRLGRTSPRPHRLPIHSAFTWIAAIKIYFVNRFFVCEWRGRPRALGSALGARAATVPRLRRLSVSRLPLPPRGYRARNTNLFRGGVFPRRISRSGPLRGITVSILSRTRGTRNRKRDESFRAVFRWRHAFPPADAIPLDFITAPRVR